MKSVLVRLREFYNQGSNTEKAIIDYVLKNPKEVSNLTIYQLAELTFSSPSTIIRLCKKNGFDGYKNFIKALIYELAIRKESKPDFKTEVTKFDKIQEIIDKVTYRNIISLEDTKNLIDYEVINKCIELIYKCENLCLFGIGSSLIVAKDAQQKFMRLNKHCTVNEDWHLQLLTARNMTSKDLAIIISYSGETAEMIECAKVMKESGVNIISITKYGNSPIVSLADFNIFVAAHESTIRSGAMSSRISQLNIIDILYTGYANGQFDKSIEQITKTHIRKGSKND